MRYHPAMRVPRMLVVALVLAGATPPAGHSQAQEFVPAIVFDTAGWLTAR